MPSSGLAHASRRRQSGKVCRTPDPLPGDRSDRGSPDLVPPITEIRVRYHQVDQPAFLRTRCTRHARGQGSPGRMGHLPGGVLPHLGQWLRPYMVESCQGHLPFTAAGHRYLGTPGISHCMTYPGLSGPFALCRHQLPEIGPWLTGQNGLLGDGTVLAAFWAA
jgi:hypothetical protein